MYRSISIATNETLKEQNSVTLYVSVNHCLYLILCAVMSLFSAWLQECLRKYVKLFTNFTWRLQQLYDGTIANLQRKERTCYRIDRAFASIREDILHIVCSIKQVWV